MKPARLLLLLVLLALLGGNYYRNWSAEQAEFRPYRGYSESELDTLIQAHRAQAQARAERYDSARKERGEVHDRALLAGC